jgi:A118 family predicted phage portal protein
MVFDTAKTKQDVYYDRNDSVYVAFDDAEKQAMLPVDINFEFRIEQIISDINVNLAILCKQCGLSDNFLSFNGASMKTATEVISENSKTFRTKKNIEISLTPVIVGFISTLKDIGAAYGINTTEEEYAVAWDDSVLEDRGAKETRIINRYNAKLITLEDALVELDGLTEEEAKEKAQAIRDGNKTVDVGSLFGGNE